MDIVIRMNALNIKGRLFAFNIVTPNVDFPTKTIINYNQSPGDLRAENPEVTIEVYRNFIRKTVLFFKRNLTESDETEIDEIIEFEQKLAGVGRSPSMQIAIKSLTENMPEFRWPEVINTLFNGTGKSINETRLVRLNGGETNFLDTYGLLMNTSSRIVANYLGWRAISYLAPYSTLEFRKNFFTFENISLSFGVDQQASLEDSCLKLVSERFPYAIGAIYFKGFFTDNDEEDARDTIKDLKDAFEVLLRRNYWMDKSTRSAALSKLRSMSEEIGEPSWMATDEELDRIYEGVCDSNCVLCLALNVVNAKTLTG